MRDLFIAPPGFVMISADYDQIELRFLSKYAKDTGLQEVFLSGEDVHTATAAKVMKCDVSEVDSENRTLKGKMPNFLIGYGGSHILLARKTGITEDEAKEVLEEYFAAFSRINPWKAHVLKKARENAVWRDGKMVVPPYVTTMMKRRRRLPDLNIITRGLSKNEWRLANKRVMRAERQAVNAVVQGSAAETTKLAMIDIDAYARREGFPLRMVINVHDEIVALCPEDCAEEGLSVMRSCMESVVNPLTGKKPLNDWVPLSAAGKVSDRWEKG
jgi:DNA polymerase I